MKHEKKYIKLKFKIKNATQKTNKHPNISYLFIEFND